MIQKLSLVLMSMFAVLAVSAQECATDEYHAYKMAHDSAYKENYLREREQVRAIYLETRNNPQPQQQAVIHIPTVVHIIHTGEPVGTGYNISDAQVLDGMQGLNDRFRALMDSTIDVEIDFCLASRDPNGCPTNGITRTDGSVVPGYSSNGMSYTNCGADQTTVQNLCRWPESQYYNIYLVWSICGGPAGYSMGLSPVPYSGTVMLTNLMSSTSTTLTHETGHGLWLSHTFESMNSGCPVDTNCTVDGDQICDTPPHQSTDCGPTNPCTSAGYWNFSRKNYMSYCTNRYLFTPDQKTMMLASINYNSILQSSPGCAATPFNPFTFVVHDMSCTNVCDGSIAVTQLAACTPLTYTYAWSTGATTSSISGLCAGTYSVVITNTLSQTVSYTFTIVNPTPMAITTSVVPGGCGASAVASVSGGRPIASSTLCTNGVTTGTIGTGTNAGNPAWYPAIYGNQYMGTNNEILILASELTSAGFVAGNINSVAFNVVSVQGAATLDGFTIRMMHTTQTDLQYMVIGPQVVMNPQTIMLTPGWNVHTLDYPFVWDGVSNIIIETCFNNSSTVPVNTQCYMTNTSFWSIAWTLSNTMNACNEYAGSFGTISRPNVQLTQCADSYTYNYQWSNGQTTATATNLAPGTYTVVVTDAGGCTATSTCTVTNGDIDPLVVNASITSTSTCSSNAASTVSGGNPSASPTLCGSGSTTATIGTGNVVLSAIAYPAVYGNYYWGARHQMLITAAELTSSGLVAGNLTSLSFDLYSALGNTSITGFTIKMKHTTTTSMTNYETGLQTVMNPQNIVVTPGWNLHAFDTPFVWDGVSNIIVEVCFNNSGWTSQNSQNYITPTPFTSVVYNFVDNPTACNNVSNIYTGSNRPNMRFTQCSDSLVYTYQWSNGQTTPDATGLTTGAYTLTVTDGDGCTGTATVVVSTGSTITAGNDTTVLPSMPVTLGGSPTAIGSAPFTYSWFPAGGLTSTVIANPVATVTITTTYVLTTTDANGCTYTDTVVVFVDPMLGTAPVQNNGNITVFPNPSDAIFYLSADGIANGEYTIVVTNVLGQIIFVKEVTATTGNLREEINAAEWNTGLYFLTVRSEHDVEVIRVEKQE